jgi:hypothetical protein
MDVETFSVFELCASGIIVSGKAFARCTYGKAMQLSCVLFIEIYQLQLVYFGSPHRSVACQFWC